MYKILTAAALLVICLVGGAIAGEPEMVVEEVIVRPGKEQPLTESDLVGRISDNIRSSAHYDRHDPQIIFGDWGDHSKYVTNQAD